MNPLHRSVFSSLLLLAFAAGLMQPSAQAGPLEELEQFHTETLQRFEENLRATAVVKTRLNAQVSGKLRQGLQGAIIPASELTAPFEKSERRLTELHQQFEKAYEKVREGTLAFDDFRHSGWTLLESGLRDRFSLVLESVRREMELLRQENSVKAKAFAKAMQDGTPRAAVQPQEQQWFGELERTHGELAAYLKSQHAEIKDRATAWGESGNDVSKALFSQLVEDELAVRDGPLGFGFDSSFQQFLDSQRWAVPPIALNKGLSLDLALPQVPPATHAEAEKERPDYPIVFTVPQPKIYGIEQFGDGIPRKASNEYWTKEHTDLARQEQLGGFDILLVVYGRDLKQWIGTTPAVSAVGADSPGYKLLGHFRIKEQGYYTFCSHLYIPLFKEFREILEKKKAAGQKTPSWDGMDAYIVKATISPTCSSGQRDFKLGPVKIPWVQPFSRNVAGIGCFRIPPPAVANDPALPPEREDMRQPLRWGFESDHVVFEIATSAPAPAGTKIRFHLVKKTAEGETPVKIGGKGVFEATKVAAHGRPWLRLPGETFSALYRSEPFVLGNAGNLTQQAIPLASGEILFAKILWPGPVREILSSPLEFHTSPREIGLTFTEALLETAHALKLPEKIANIPGAPQRDRDAAIARLAEVKAGKVSTNGTFIDFSSEKYGSADAAYELTVGEAAVLLMLREHMIAAGEQGLKKYQELFNQVKVAMTPHDLSVLPGPYLALDQIRAMVLTSAPGSPLGQAFANYYSEPASELLKRYHWQWRMPVPARIHQGAVYVEPELRAFLKKAEASLSRLKKTDARNPAELFDLVALGAESWTPFLAGRFVRLRETPVPQQQWWQPDPLAPALLQSVAGKAQAIVSKQKQSDAYDGAVAGTYAPVGLLFLKAKGLLAMAGVGLDLLLASDTYVDVTEYYSRGAAMEYTESMAVLTGGQVMWTRLQGQSSLSKPGWITALGVFGNSLGIVAQGFQLPRILSESRVQAREFAIATALHGPFPNYAPLKQAAILDEVNRVVSEARRGVALTGEETEVLESATGFLTRTEKASIDDLARRPAELTSLADRNHHPGTTYFSAFKVPPESLEEGRAVIRAALEGTLRESGGTRPLADLLNGQVRGSPLSGEFLETLGLTIQRLPDPPKSGTLWHGFQLGKPLGKGTFSFVFEHGDDLVVKIGALKEAGENPATYVRVLYGSHLLDEARIPQIALHPELSRQIGDNFALIQDILPDGSIMLKWGAGKEVPLVGANGTLTDLKVFRYEGINLADLRSKQWAGRLSEAALASQGSKPMASDYAKPLLKLYKKFIDNNLIWADGSLGNIVFVKEGREWVAKVLDSDFIWDFGKNFRFEGPIAKTGNYHIDYFYRFISEPKEFPDFVARLQSMAGGKLSIRDLIRIEDGVHLAPSAEFYMLKMLEYHHYIYWDRAAQRWIDGLMKVEDVEKVFPSIHNRAWIDPDFSKLFRGAVILPLRKVFPRGNRPPSDAWQSVALAA